MDFKMAKKKDGFNPAGYIGCAFICICALALCGGALGSISGIYPDYSNGERAGKLYKISKKGLFAKPYEGTLLLSEMRGADEANAWEFSCQDEDVGKKLTELAGKKVKVTYRQWMIGPWYQYTPYTVISVEEDKTP